MTRSSRADSMILADLQMLAEIFDPARTLTPLMQNIKQSLTEISTLHLDGFTGNLRSPEELAQAVEYIVLILKHDPNITEIRMANNSFPSDLAQKIGTAIADNENLEIINLNNTSLGSLSDTIPFLEKMATHPSAEELHMANSIPADEIRGLMTVTENQLSYEAKQFLAVSYLYEETHDEPIDYGTAQSHDLTALGTLEQKIIEHQLMGTSEPFTVYVVEDEEEALHAMNYTNDEYIIEENAAGLLKTSDFITSISTTDDLTADVLTSEHDIDKSSAAEESITMDTKKTINKLQDLEALVSMIELYDERILDDKLALSIQQLEKLDLSRLYNKLDDSDKETFVHLLVSLASLKHHLKKIDLGHNHFSTEHLQTVLAAFSQATQKKDRANPLEKLSLHHAIETKQLTTVANELEILQSNLKSGVSLDPKRKRDLKNLQKDLDAPAAKHIASARIACEDYLDYLERKIILPLVKENKSLRETYPGIENSLNNAKIMKKIINDLSSSESSPIKSLKNDTQFRMAIQKYRIIKSLENITNDPSLSASARKRQLDQRYYEKKVELPQLLLKNDKEQYNRFLQAFGDEKALTDIKTIGYAGKSRKPQKFFFDKTDQLKTKSLVLKEKNKKIEKAKPELPKPGGKKRP